MKYCSFSLIYIYKIFQLLGLISFTWPFMGNNKIVRDLVNAMFYIVFASNFVIVFIPLFLFTFLNDNEKMDSLVSTDFVIFASEIIFNLLYCKLKNNHYKVSHLK